MISKFIMVVFDFFDFGDDLLIEVLKLDLCYYFCLFKMIMVRIVVDGGESYYVWGDYC